MVPSEPWEAIDVWRFYNQRCCMENYIKEAKRGFSTRRIPTDDFAANEMNLLNKLFAYNLFERLIIVTVGSESSGKPYYSIESTYIIGNIAFRNPLQPPVVWTFEILDQLSYYY